MEFSRTLPRHTVDEPLYLLNIKGKANQEITKEGGAPATLNRAGAERSCTGRLGKRQSRSLYEGESRQTGRW